MGAEVRRRERGAFRKRIAYRGDCRAAHEWHVGKRDYIAIDFTCGARGAGKTRAHAVGRVLAHHDLAAFASQLGGERLRCGADHGDDARQFRFQMPCGLHCDRDAVWQVVAKLVGAKARRRSGGEQQPDELQGVLTSQAEGSKRRSGFAAQLGSDTPCRTAVISARMATAISGGVFEPI